MTDTHTVKEATRWRTREYSYVEGGSTYGGEVKSWIAWVFIATAAVSATALLVSGAMFLSYTYDKAHCEAEARVRPEVNYEYSFWGGCQRGYDNNSRLELDGEVDVNVNTEED